jgi:hypothetical protein
LISLLAGLLDVEDLERAAQLRCPFCRAAGRCGWGAVVAGVGEVWFAASPTGEPVALKVIRPELVARPTVRERFALEVDSLRLVFGSRIAGLEGLTRTATRRGWLCVTCLVGP